MHRVGRAAGSKGDGLNVRVGGADLRHLHAGLAGSGQLFEQIVSLFHGVVAFAVHPECGPGIGISTSPVVGLNICPRN